MSIARILTLAAALVAFATGAAAQTPAATQPRRRPAWSRRRRAAGDGPARFSPTLSSISSRAASTAATPSSAGKDRAGSAPITTSCGSSRRARCKATARSMTASTSSSTSRAITTYFDLQGGLRSDIDSRPTRNWAAFGIQGLAPYFFDLEAHRLCQRRGPSAPPSSRPPTTFSSRSG